MVRTVHDEIRSATRALAAAGIPAPEADAIALAAHAGGWEPGDVRRRMVLREPVEAAFTDRFDALVAERARRVPLQHLTGVAYFRDLALEVGPGVFIPRPETELAAGLAIAEARRVLARATDEVASSAGADAASTATDGAPSGPVVVDLCTGSGAIAFAVKDEEPRALVHAVEISPEAHAWAARNLERLGLTVDLRLGDALTAFEDLFGCVDIVTANPPYIPRGMVPLDPEVRDHDPEIALYGASADGLALPRLVAARAASLLRPGGLLIMEHADSQGVSLPRALAATGAWTSVADHRDLAGRPRTTTARRAYDGGP